ncbi:Uma2 family endonuclease [Spirulina major]|uniref:Uma2 family endonuclease n=1 Tax=Spirulina major TaxID=270636 RepID=UPI001114D5FB|nr:Uma2 family endonuclease [Spirulina major]
MVQIPFEASTRYPDSDGKPMAENTLQYQWIVRLVENLKRMLAGQNAFVAGDLLWYPVQAQPGETPLAQAPDAMVVIGRPDHCRGSYKQWDEENIAPQVVFEIISPSNSAAEMTAKQAFYIEHGVLELYFYNPQSETFWGLVRGTVDDKLEPVMPLNMPWVSPLLQIRFELFEDGLAVFYPDGEPFKTLAEFAQERDRLAAKLRELGINPDDL